MTSRERQLIIGSIQFSVEAQSAPRSSLFLCQHKLCDTESVSLSLKGLPYRCRLQQLAGSLSRWRAMTFVCLFERARFSTREIKENIVPSTSKVERFIDSF